MCESFLLVGCSLTHLRPLQAPIIFCFFSFKIEIKNSTPQIYVENPNTGAFRSVIEAVYLKELQDRRAATLKHEALHQDPLRGEGDTSTLPIENLRAQWRAYMLSIGSFVHGLLGGFCAVLLLVQYLAHPLDWIRDGTSNSMLGYDGS